MQEVTGSSPVISKKNFRANPLCFKHYLVNFLYVVLFGTSLSSPNCCFFHSAYSDQLPSNQRTSELFSNASMCVQMRSRNQRSWLTTSAHPAKSSNASSRARTVCTSRSFVGSSRSRTLPDSRSIMPRLRRFFSPPESTLTFLFWSAPAKLNHEQYACAFTSRTPPSSGRPFSSVAPSLTISCPRLS